jgi:hypothetical protein
MPKHPGYAATVYPLNLRYPLGILSYRSLIYKRANNIAALLQLIMALFFSDLILLSKELFSTHGQSGFRRNARKLIWPETVLQQLP